MARAVSTPGRIAPAAPHVPTRTFDDDIVVLAVDGLFVCGRRVCARGWCTGGGVRHWLAGGMCVRARAVHFSQSAPVDVIAAAAAPRRGVAGRKSGNAACANCPVLRGTAKRWRPSLVFAVQCFVHRRCAASLFCASVCSLPPLFCASACSLPLPLSSVRLCAACLSLLPLSSVRLRAASLSSVRLCAASLLCAQHASVAQSAVLRLLNALRSVSLFSRSVAAPFKRVTWKPWPRPPTKHGRDKRCSMAAIRSLNMAATAVVGFASVQAALAHLPGTWLAALLGRRSAVSLHGAERRRAPARSELPRPRARASTLAWNRATARTRTMLGNPFPPCSQCSEPAPAHAARAITYSRLRVRSPHRPLTRARALDAARGRRACTHRRQHLWRSRCAGPAPASPTWPGAAATARRPRPTTRRPASKSTPSLAAHSACATASQCVPSAPTRTCTRTCTRTRSHTRPRARCATTSVATGRRQDPRRRPARGAGAHRADLAGRLGDPGESQESAQPGRGRSATLHRASPRRSLPLSLSPSLPLPLSRCLRAARAHTTGDGGSGGRAKGGSGAERRRGRGAAGQPGPCRVSRRDPADLASARGRARPCGYARRRCPLRLHGRPR